MQIINNAIIVMLAASTVLASPAYHFRPTFNGTNHHIEQRKVITMKGKCVAYGMVKAEDKKLHSCWNSHCSDDQVSNKQEVRLAQGMDGSFVAKCPSNDLDFAWQWPEGQKAPWE
jgi:hypothetical protein